MCWSAYLAAVVDVADSESVVDDSESVAAEKAKSTKKQEVVSTVVQVALNRTCCPWSLLVESLGMTL